MLRFDGTYTLARKEDPGSSHAYACSWNVKVIDFSSSDPSHPHIRPCAVLAVRQAGGIFKSSCAESLGKRIVKDFDLKVDDLLWVESFPDVPQQLFVAVFTPRYGDAGIHYTITWRPILENEQNAVAPWFQASE
ncbi:hypothetical protein [Desulfosarcina ovata]|uniref:Uncharacterized protein n=2 Tax=Desulfosarcina ovata TaxID=83564 RepID=A0A5K8AJ57_9BACT|nr:hypothetical protein [Desulfosarcina ovata]BBO92536.1 hypothetical protein DSCOOX_57160 [Desulfosarcina ovata subsp. ovata]